MMRQRFLLAVAVVCVPLAAETAAIRLKPYRQAVADQSSSGAGGIQWFGLTARATDGATWTGTDRGVWREPASPDEGKRYFASKRWLADDRVTALAPDSAGGMWVRTATGVSHIRFETITLAEKARRFAQRIEQRHVRHGFVTGCNLREPGKLSTFQLRSDDNDGLWTAMHAAAESFHYAVTKSSEARHRAERSVRALLRLEQATGRPGLPARSFIVPGESRPADGVWFPVPDGSLTWKGDTSSDEIVGHYYALAVAYDLLPDAKLRQDIIAVTRRITDHLLDNHLMLTDIHGMPTWWGRWDEMYLQSERGKPDSPLQAVEILSFLKTAFHITKDQRYQREYLRLANDRGYATLTTKLNELRGPVVNYSDEELAMLSFYPLLRFETDPKLLAVYRRALDQWWENMPRQKNPLWTFIYRAGQGKTKTAEQADIAAAIWTLQRIPMDLISWTIDNSQRSDVEWEGEADRFGRRQSRTLLPPDERPIMKWNGNPFRVDGGNDGRSEDDGTFFLLPYWMGRYHRYLEGE